MRTVSACLFITIIFAITELHECRHGLFSLPVSDRRYKDYFHNNTHHEYTPSETGNDIFGHYLGHKLGKLTTPTYSHKSFYDGNRPLYDHYTVHQYFHQKKAVAARQEIPSNKIRGCVGDSMEVCPANTTSLCTKDGKLMCVTSTASTVLCNENQRNRCVKSEISCQYKLPGYQCNKNGKIPINIPCISTIKIDGHVNITNNTVLEAFADGNIAHTFFINVRNGPKSQESKHVLDVSQTGDSGLYVSTSDASPLHVNIGKIDQEFCVTVVAVPSATMKL